MFIVLKYGGNCKLQDSCDDLLVLLKTVDITKHLFLKTCKCYLHSLSSEDTEVRELVD